MKFFSWILSASLIMLIIGLPVSSCMSGSPGNQEEKTGQEIYHVKELQADFKQFRKFLEGSHPQLYRFTSKKTFDSLFEAHHRMIDHSMTTQEFYRILVPLVVRAGCGHTSLWAPDGYWDRAPQRMVPLGVYAREGQLFVIHSFNQAAPVKYGSQIVSSNRFIDSSFQVIHDHEIQNLVIDLRGNDGGDPFCSSHLLAYIQKKPVIYFRQPYGSYARLIKPLPMAENPFKGSQYYLIDGMCFSTTGHITSLLKYYGLGTFIGEETGATYTCNDASHDTQLKHTGYRLQSARGTFATAVIGFPLEQGILPDHPVHQSIDEVIMNQDAVLEYTLQLIKQKSDI
jgi:hypothetical protein